MKDGGGGGAAAAAATRSLGSYALEELLVFSDNSLWCGYLIVD